MEKEQNIMKMEILNMKVILLMIIMKDMENIFVKMVIIILDNFWIIIDMVKEYCFLKMEILKKRVIGLMMNLLKIK